MSLAGSLKPAKPPPVNRTPPQISIFLISDAFVSDREVLLLAKIYPMHNDHLT
jgi:hypothetical protein